MITLKKVSRVKTGVLIGSFPFLAMVIIFVLPSLNAQTSRFHNAPTSADQLKNPFVGQRAADEAGATLYSADCASCHGIRGQGSGNVPPLVSETVRSAQNGQLFWFITKGDADGGMPGWAQLSERQRWQIVTYLKSGSLLKVQPPADTANHADAGLFDAPPPKAPFTDFRYEKPGNTRKITVQDIPEPFATESARNGAQLVARRANAWPKAPAGFKVNLFATGLNQPRYIATAPNGDIFLAESAIGQIRVFRGITADSKPGQVAVFATGLNRPYGIAFYPPGPNPKWVYIGDTDAVMRFPYQNGDLKARGGVQHVVDLPHGPGHWTRSIAFTRDGKSMFVSVGSGSNIDDPDTHPDEKDRADILEFNPNHSDMRIYAYGIRNAGGGIAIDPKTGELWASVNERDALGDNLVPDYITHVQQGGFYGWPWWYMGGHQDPRHKGTHPELQAKVITPDVLLQPHNASLQLTFYNGKQFPPQYDGDIFAAEHGSWNKDIRVGYELVRVPLHQTGKATGEYEDFLTGFVLSNGEVWGRPVGVTVGQDGSLLVTDDGSNSIWRVSYTGK
ncbi:MAG TPA: PQQ-dependent sugar dehydrogenase [Candidatus Acidoferrales bacterium]|nr:PQQ-dependent sugar dehydrogenase [Candidatus Acidoferrales bacterium]